MAQIDLIRDEEVIRVFDLYVESAGFPSPNGSCDSEIARDISWWKLSRQKANAAYQRDQLILLNGKYGTCVSCPSYKGIKDPTRCDYADRGDHNSLSLSNVIRKVVEQNSSVLCLLLQTVFRNHPFRD